jgi:hypothetical protein
MEYAIKKNDLNLIKRLIENGEDINSTFTLWYADRKDIKKTNKKCYKTF